MAEQKVFLRLRWHPWLTGKNGWFSPVNIVSVTFLKNLLATPALVDNVSPFPNRLGADHPKQQVKR